MKVLVTGGGGFLGGVLVRKLVARGDTVRSFSRGAYPALEELGVTHVQGDITDRDALTEAATECDAVYHVAAKPGAWGPYLAYYEANVLGTKNVIEACHAANVPTLVYTSSPSVTFAGRDQNGINEDTPYPKRFLAHYPKTKAMAEKLVLSANDGQLATLALRPHLIWGPNDNQLIPRIVDRAKAGTLRIVGSGKQRVDAVYVDNAADAHILACDRLVSGAPCAGKAYYISNDEPWPIERLINAILKCASVPPVHRHIPGWVANAAGAVLEATYFLTRNREEPPMTRFIARQLATAHWYNINAAKRDLGYRPAVSMDEGMERLAKSIRQPPNGL